MKYQFLECDSIEEQNINFLCGTAYNFKESENDKRVILKKYLQDKIPQNKNVILEEHFAFSNFRNKLNYQDIFMNDLNDIEMLTAAFASKIIIIHESISTGAELGAFASKRFMHDRICVLAPDSTAIEESKISSFLRLAYFRKKTTITNITFYPETYKYPISKNHIEKRTNFKSNQITPIFGSKICEFIKKENGDKIQRIKFEVMKYGKPSSEFGMISVSVKENKSEVFVSSRVVLYQIISLFQFSEFKTEIRKDKNMIGHVNYIVGVYRETMKNTVDNYKCVHLDTVSISIKELDVKFRDVVAYALYMIEALGYINIKTIGEIKKISITNKMDEEVSKYAKITKVKQPYLVLE